LYQLPKQFITADNGTEWFKCKDIKRTRIYYILIGYGFDGTWYLIQTRLWAELAGFNSQQVEWWDIFSSQLCSDQLRGLIEPPIQWALGDLNPEVKGLW